MNLEELTAGTFSPHLGESFRVSGSAAPPFDAILVDVTEGADQGGSSRRQFSIVFRGGPADPQPQSIYRLEHDALGALEIFIVPIGPDDEGQRYEAVFT